MNDAALIAANLFSGGQETTVRLLSFALRMLAERPDLQRAHSRGSSTRSRTSSRRRSASRAHSAPNSGWRASGTQLGGMDIPAGSSIMLVPGACNRDPRVFDNPYEFDIDRSQRTAAHCVRSRHPHLRRSATGSRRGPGHDQPVPRSHLGHHHLEKHHGPPGAWRYEYLPTFFLRGLQRLHLEFDT